VIFRRLFILGTIGILGIIGLEVLFGRTSSKQEQLTRAWRQTAESALVVVKDRQRLPISWEEIAAQPPAPDLPWKGVRRHVEVDFGLNLELIRTDPVLRRQWITMPKDRVDLQSQYVWLDGALSAPPRP